MACPWRRAYLIGDPWNIHILILRKYLDFGVLAKSFTPYEERFATVK